MKLLYASRRISAELFEHDRAELADHVRQSLCQELARQISRNYPMESHVVRDSLGYPVYEEFSIVIKLEDKDERCNHCR